MAFVEAFWAYKIVRRVWGKPADIAGSALMGEMGDCCGFDRGDGRLDYN